MLETKTKIGNENKIIIIQAYNPMHLLHHKILTNIK